MVKTYFEDEEDRRRYWRQLKRMQRQRKKGIMSKSMSFQLFSYHFHSHSPLIVFSHHIVPLFLKSLLQIIDIVICIAHPHVSCLCSCPLVSFVSRIFINVLWCPLMSFDVFWCLLMLIDVLWCQSMFSHILCIHWRLLMSPDDNPCPLLSSIFVVFIVVLSCLSNILLSLSRLHIFQLLIIFLQRPWLTWKQPMLQFKLKCQRWIYNHRLTICIN